MCGGGAAVSAHYSYDEATRTVFLTATGHAVCTVAEYPDIEATHRMGRLISALLNASEWRTRNG